MELVKARMSVDAKGDYKKKTNDWDSREGCVRPMTGLRKTDDFQLTHKVSLVSTNQVFLPHFMHTYLCIWQSKFDCLSVSWERDVVTLTLCAMMTRSGSDLDPVLSPCLQAVFDDKVSQPSFVLP